MNARMIAALLRKDIILFINNRFFAFITVLGLVFYAGIYFLLPADLDEALEMAIYAPDAPPHFLGELAGDEALRLVEMESLEALQTAVREGDYGVGVALPPDFVMNVAAGRPETVHIYFAAEFPDEFKELYAALFQEIGFMLGGQPLNLEVTEEVLGADLAGSQIPYRERLLPLFAVFILLMEMMSLASLIAGEIGGGTLSALLVTPLRVEGLFVAKGTFGVGLAFSQVVILMAVTGGLSQQPWLMLLTLLLGSLLVTGIGFLIASVATDLMSVMGWGMLGLLALALPAFAVLIPGLVADWVKIIPSHYLVNVVYRVNNFGWGWQEAGQDLLILFLFSVLFFGAGIAVLRRRFQ